MPSRSPTAHFLGLELATDQLRAAVVDEQLDLVGVEVVDFDSELAGFQTHGGIFTTPGDAYTTPVEMWIKALDLLLQKLEQNFDLTKIKSIGGSAQHACVWWKNSIPASLLRFSDPAHSLHDHLFSTGNPFSLPNTPVAQDTSTLPQALAIEHALGGPDKTAARLGAPAHASLLSAHALRMRETQPDVWRRTGRISLASTLLCSLLLGGWAPSSESEACATGMWSHPQRAWDEGVLEIVAGSNSFEHMGRLKMMLGDVDVQGGGRKIGSISPYFVERYGFSPDTILTPFTSDYLSTYLSLCPSPTDAVLSFGPMDVMLTTAPHYLPNRLYTLFPHPAQEPNEKRRYIVMLTSRNGDVPRALVRDMYTKSWSAFDRLLAIVPPGGSIGLDDKLFSFWHLQAEAFPFSHVKGIFRFETGVKVNEFRDLRANPRCLLESQLLSFRVRYARMRASNLFFSANTRTSPASQQALNTSIAGPTLSFDPYSTAPLPRRLVATGAAANFPAVVNLLGDVFNAPIFVPATQLDSAHAVAPAGPGAAGSGPAAQFAAAHRNAPAPGFASRAALGSAFVARWVWTRERAAGPGASAAPAVAYEDEVRRLLARRWNLRSKQQSAGGAHSPAPYMQHQRSAGLGADVLVEEEEEDEEEEGDYVVGAMGAGLASSLTLGLGGLGLDALGPASTPMPASTPPPRVRTATGSSLATSGSGFALSPGPGGSGGALTALTSPDGQSGTGTPTDAPASAGGGITPLTPVGALPTGDVEAQLGWAKVAEPDVDAFMAYASIVPEFVRLEGLLVKSLV
ncbi:actin-like ATPase domain-containing protein [Phellopilus nigrolimitatus]|nr:actin-like ATPase domain-containing protein [Phellopilus nigrolimitatus]